MSGTSSRGGSGPDAADLHLRRLAALADEAMEATDVETLLEHVATTATALLPAAGASIVLVDAKQQGFEVSVSTLPGQSQRYVLERIRGSGGATRWILEHRRPHVAPDVDHDPFGANTMLRDAGMHAYVGVPLVFRDAAIGVLYAMDRERRDYAPSDIDFMTVLARRAASAIGLAQVVEELETLTRTDELTGIANRREFIRRAEAEIERRGRTGSPLSVAVLDLDRFKGVNDECGHPAGDIVLQEVARRCGAIVRANDVFARLGGEEFGVLLPDSTLEEARRVAERMRAVVGEAPVDISADASRPHPSTVSLTLTGGVAEHRPDESLTSVLGRADRAMYRGKAAGRNRIMVDADTEDVADTTTPTADRP